METTKYVKAELAIPTNSEASSQSSPKRLKWPAVKKVLGKPRRSDPIQNTLRLELSTTLYSTLTPFYSCLTDSTSLNLLLEDLRRKDSELATYLEAEKLHHDSNPTHQTLSEDREIDFNIGDPNNNVEISPYIDFLATFTGLVLRSPFLSSGHDSSIQDPHGVLRSLANNQCPEDLLIFRRVFVSPCCIGVGFQEGELPELHNGIPVTHLAKFLDVAVVNLLSAVTEHTSFKAVSWALDYLLKLLGEIYKSLSLLGSPGWYGAPPIRSRKRTATNRPSISCRPSNLTLPVVVVGTPPSSPRASPQPPNLILDPETGQHSPRPSPSLGTRGASPNPPSLPPSLSPISSQPLSLFHDKKPGSPFHRSPSPLFSTTRHSADREQEQASVAPFHLEHTFPTDSPQREKVSPSPDDIPVRRGRSPRSMSPPSLGSIQEHSIQDKSPRSTSPTPDDEVKSKIKSLSIPQVDKEQELCTGVNGEGRISLIAILNAIAHLPQSDELWNTEIGDKCFSVIQLCLDLGLPPKSHEASQAKSAQSKRQKFKAQDNLAFSSHGVEKPNVVHTKCVVEASVNALIQCATGLIVGCANESSYCSLRHLRLPYQSHFFHSRLIRLLQRIDDHSPASFRQALANFSEPSNSTARKLFHFLHVILQYCTMGGVEAMGTTTLKVDVVVSVLRSAVDRLVGLDITEQSIQNSVVSEACSFFQYAHTILVSHSLSHIHGTKHLEMYLHRIALSVILPPPPSLPDHTHIPANLEGAATPLLELRGNKRGLSKQRDVGSPTDSKSSTLPPKVHANIQLSLNPHKGLGERSRSGSFNLASVEPAAKPKAKFKKQHSLHSDLGWSSPSSQSVDGANLEKNPSITGESLVDGEESESKWQGLQLDLLRGRIQRLVVLLNTTVPGTVPDPDMLASLIDLCDGRTVVARAMVLLECAMFVNKLRSQQLPTVWVIHNKEQNAHLMRSVSHHLGKWGEAISNKLRLIELRERETKNRMKFVDKASQVEPVLIEEPVFPKSESSEEVEYTSVSYAIKMAACQLLLEITRFLRNPPEQFCGWSINRNSMSHLSSVMPDEERRCSFSSNQSSDNESLPGGGFMSLPVSGVSQLYSPAAPPIGRFGSTLSVEDAETLPRQNSMEESSGSASPAKKRVSVYLRVNSNGGTVSRSSSLRRSPKVFRTVIDSPGQVRANTSSSAIHSRREALTASTVNALHQSLYNTGNTRSRRPSVAGMVGSVTVTSHHPLPAKYRRQSVGAPLIKQASLETAPGERLTHNEPPASSKTSNAGLTLNSLREKARRAMHTLRRRPTKPRMNSESGPSPNSSPNFRRKLFSTSRNSIHGGSFSSHYGCEDRSLPCPWLGVVEHLVVVEHSTGYDQYQLHTLACRQLISALKMVYAAKYQEEENVSEPVMKGPTMSRSLSLVFTHRIARSLDIGEGGSSTTRSSLYRNVAFDNFSHRRSQKSRPLQSGRVHSMPSALSKIPSSTSSDSQFSRIDFSRLSSIKFSSTLMAAGNDDESVELFLEAESPFPRAYLSAELDKRHREYLTSELLGMMHVPFSILVHTGPALHPSTLTRLKPLAWEVLLDQDTELSRAAAAFFLLSCVKESSSSMKGFIKDRVIRGGPNQQRQAIQKFKVLWETRYQVWPRMEEWSQKKLGVNDGKTPDDKLKTIGYSLPANPLGHVADTLPLAPWDFTAVCTNKTCVENPNLCYRSTQHIAVVHAEEITEAVQDYTVSGVSVLQEASSKPANVYLGIGSDDDMGNIEWEAVKTNLFPHSLLPLIRFLIMSLQVPPPCTSTPSQPHSSTPSQLDISELAAQVVWQCMLEDEYLFFQPLLDEFNKVYSLIKEDPNKPATAIEKILADIVEPLHVLLQSCHTLPSRAAHFLFNNFVGVIMKHTDQPMVHSPRIIQSMLTLIEMVAPSVQGLDSKVLKNSLKKESCYTTIMTMARIRGVEKVVVTDVSGKGHSVFPISDGMTFANLIAKACQSDSISLELLNNWYLFDAGKGIPVLSSLYIKDQYSSPVDGQYPSFILKAAARSDHLWARQMDQLFMHKMSEMMRVQFTTKLLHTGPLVEKGVAYSEYAQPNYQFIHKELVELTSFPRKALTSVLREAGQGVLSHYPLYTSDIMLKGSWVRFVLQLFCMTKSDFTWDDSMLLFLNVVNGALLLHGENHTLLQLCLVTLLTAAAKFSTVFKHDGYQMVVPVVIQTFALHLQDHLITDALKFLWHHFYKLDGNTFVSQVAASASTLFSERVASLSSKISSSHVPLPPTPPQMEAEHIRRLQVRAVTELFHSLEVWEPHDDLNVLPLCQQCLDEPTYSRLTSEPAHRLSLVNSAALWITLCTWNPEALRGMQVLVCMDHLSMHFLHHMGNTNTSIIRSLEYLIRGCESIGRHHQFRRDNTSSHGGPSREIQASDPQTPGYPAGKTFSLDIDESDQPKMRSSAVRKVSVVIQRKFRKLVNPNQKSPGLQGYSSQLSMSVGERENPVRVTRSGVLGIDHNIITSQFKLRRLQLESQQILQMSRDSLLSIATQFVAHFAKVRINEGRSPTRRLSHVLGPPPRTKVTFEPHSVMVLTFVAIQLLKQCYTNDRYEGVLQGRGLTGFMTILLPNIEWSEPYFSSFQNLLNRFIKFFKYLQKESSKAMMVWDSLTGFVNGLSQTIHNSPQLVQGQEQHLQKLKLLLETIVISPYSGGGNPQNQSASALKRYRSIQRIQTPLLECAPVSFSDAVVGLAVELIVLTQNATQSRLRYHLSDLVYHKIIKEHQDPLMSKIVLPLCIQLGLRDDMEQPSVRDAEFVLDYFDQNVSFVIKPNINPSIMSQKLPPEAFFRDLKVVCLAFSETFTLAHWHTISRWIISLTHRKANVLGPLKVVSLNQEEGTRPISRGSFSSVSSQSGPATHLLESFLVYHNHLLRFFETFLVMYQIPLLSLLSPLLRVAEQQLKSVRQEVKSDSPALFKDVNECIERCQALLSSGFNSVASVSRHQLLQRINDNLRHMALPSRVHRSNTTADTTNKPTRLSIGKKRRMSYSVLTQSPLSKIGEEDQDSELLLQTNTLPKRLVPTPEHRPDTLKWKGKSITKTYVPPPVTHSKGQSSLSLDAPNKKNLSLQRPRRKAQLPTMKDRKRAPRLGTAGKSESSGFYADTEDADVVSPEDSIQLAVNNSIHNDSHMIQNPASLSAKNSPVPSKRTVSYDPQSEPGLDDLGKQSLLVSVDVHENQGSKEHSRIQPLDSNESTGSAATLIPLDDIEEGVANLSQSLPSASYLSARMKRKVSFSTDVKVSAPNLLSLGLKEASKYLYHHLDRKTN